MSQDIGFFVSLMSPCLTPAKSRYSKKCRAKYFVQMKLVVKQENGYPCIPRYDVEDRKSVVRIEHQLMIIPNRAELPREHLSG